MPAVAWSSSAWMRRGPWPSWTAWRRQTARPRSPASVPSGLAIEPAGAAEAHRRRHLGEGRTATGVSRVVMFVYNDVRTDARVLREAATLAAAGHERHGHGPPDAS